MKVNIIYKTMKEYKPFRIRGRDIPPRIGSSGWRIREWEPWVVGMGVGVGTLDGGVGVGDVGGTLGGRNGADPDGGNPGRWRQE